MKDLLEQLQLICNELKDENEFDIINEYGCSATRLTAALTSKIFLDSRFSSKTTTLLFRSEIVKVSAKIRFRVCNNLFICITNTLFMSNKVFVTYIIIITTL